MERSQPAAHPASGLRVVLIAQAMSGLVTALAECRHELVGIVHAAENRPDLRVGLPCRIIRSIWSRLRGGSSLARLARTLRAPFFHYTERGLDPELFAWLRANRPDVIVVYGMGWLLDPRILSLPPLGTINLHPALLPRYRGPRPTQWTYHQMDLESGVTVHFLDAGEDTGDILLQERFSIAPGTGWNALHRESIEPAATRLILRALDALAAGTAERHPQPRESPTPRARFIPPREYTRLIDWVDWPIERVWHFLRGAPPWVRPITQLPGAPWWIDWEVCEYRREPTRHTAGHVIRSSAGWMLACRDGHIHLRATVNPPELLRRFLCSPRSP